MSEAGLEHYLAAFESRLRRLAWLRGVAVLTALALLFTIVGAWLTIRTGFAAGMLIAVRLLGLAGLAIVAVLSIAVPLRRLRRERQHLIEAQANEFDGRLQTYAGLAPGHPFRPLLAQDALAIAQRHAPDTHVSAARLAGAGVALALPAAALLWLAAAGPGLYRDGTRALWGGWLFGSLLPAQRMSVLPGDQTVRLGGTITVRSYPQGFDPASAQLHARVGTGPWQRIDMTREGPDFAFTFFSMREAVSYYVSAAGVRSRAYRLSVVAVPGIEQLRLVYRYPDWTHLPEHVQDGNGDISAIAGTRVQVRMHASVALPAAELVVDGVATPMQTAGADGQAQLLVTRDARYYLATRIGGERVRLSDDFLIRRLPVAAPSVQLTWPGRDYSASSIEEVTADVQAGDPYGLTSLQLRYSVNGGPWHAVTLPASGTSASGEHVFPLESLHTDVAPRALAPGDLISYYAIARGHELSTQSDLYFIDVQPFDRRYSQSQAGATGMDASEQQQISERQRQILLSTWNLLRGESAAGATSQHDNAALLATLQTRLAAQAQTLAGRTQSRELSQDPKIARFIDSMRHAAAAMQPAATHLAAAQLSAAVAPEQQALQYLLQAQSQFTDMQLSRQDHGNGSQSGRDLSQIYQLEMDLQKNQYENGAGASPDKPDQQSEALARRLQELARRQQQLADQMQRQTLSSPEQRWQQQSLQRETQDLQRELASQPPAQASGSGGGAGTGSASTGSGSTGGAGTSDASAGSASTGSGAGAGTTLTQRLAAAIGAMGEASRASAGAGAAGGRQDDASAAARRAQQALAQAAEELTRQQAQRLQQSVAQLANRAQALYSQQAAAAQALQSLDPADGLGQRGIADQKRALSAGVRQLDDAIAAAAQAHRGDAPATAEALRQARAAITGPDLANRLDITAQALDQGAARSLTAGEGQITQGLAEVQRRLQTAVGIAGQSTERRTTGGDPIADELARLRALRSQLMQAANTAQTAGSQSGNGAGTAGTAKPGGVSKDTGAANDSLAADVRGVATGAARLGPLLRAQGADVGEIAGLERLARTLSDSPPVPGGRTPDAQRLRAEVDLLDALELQLERRAGAGEAIRTAQSGRGAEQYQSAVAEYYRQLSRQ